MFSAVWRLLFIRSLDTEERLCSQWHSVAGGQEISYKQKKLGSIELDVDMCWDLS